jgi:uncharacterized protein (DUF2461 family)
MKTVGINEETLDFFKEIESNNNEAWFEANKKRWEASQGKLRCFYGGAASQNTRNRWDSFQRSLATAEIFGYCHRII